MHNCAKSRGISSSSRLRFSNVLRALPRANVSNRLSQTFFWKDALISWAGGDGMAKLLIATLLLVSAPPLAAQICGSLPDASEHLQAHSTVFIDESHARSRAALEIRVIDRDVSIELVTDTATCRALMRKEVEMLGIPNVPDSETYAIYRYGPYYSIEYTVPSSPNPNVRVHGWQRLRIYTVGNGHQMKGTINLGWDDEPRSRTRLPGRNRR
jgi:hypothetical protein